METEPDLASMSKVLDIIALEVAKNGRSTAELHAEVSAGFGRVDHRLGRLETQVGRLETQVGRLETQVGRLETRVEDVEGEIKAVRGDIAKLARRSNKD